MESVEPLRPEFFSFLRYKEIELPSLELELDDSMKAVFPDGTVMEMTGRSFESLCQLIQVPFGFAKKLTTDGKSHVLAYLQKQLSRAITDPVVVVCKGEEEVLCFVEKHKIPLQADNFHLLDEEILDLIANPNYPWKLVKREYASGDFLYYFDQGSQVIEEDPTKSSYRIQKVLHYSAVGLHFPYIYEIAIREEDSAVYYLSQGKPNYIESSTFPMMKNEILSEVESLEQPAFSYLAGCVGKLVNANASLREVKDARQKLLKTLKVDKEDKDTPQRIEEIFKWRKIAQAYDLKNIVPKPSKKWFMSAGSPYSLFYVYSQFAKEITHAPNTLEFEKRLAMWRWAGKAFDRVPDLAEKAPPKVDW